MSLVESINWEFLEVFFGEYGKLITAALGVLVAVISLWVAIYRHRHAQTLERILGKGADQIQQEQEFLRKGRAALQAAKDALELQRQQIQKREDTLNFVREAFVGKEHDLWCMHRAAPPADYKERMIYQRRKPVILVANLKGGVGKSTLTANLAAYFSKTGKRVLLIDGDYQGSLSNMVLSADETDRVTPEINKLLEPAATLDSFRSAIYQFTGRLGGSSIVASNYELAQIENRLMIEYLLQESKEDDGRYRLAKVFLDDEVAETFDVALVDAPPRLTAATINGFCASTHLLVPTVYDKMSAEAIGTFLNGAQILKAHLNSSIDLLGVVGMLTAQQGALNVREQNAKNAASHQVSKVWGANYHFFDRHIPRKEAIARTAGEDIAYFCDDTVQGWFNDLGNAISQRLWPQPVHLPAYQPHAARQSAALIPTAVPAE